MTGGFSSFNREPAASLRRGVVFPRQSPLPGEHPVQHAPPEAGDVVDDGEHRRDVEQRQEGRGDQPPTTATAMGERNSTSAPQPMAMGTMPAPMAKVVIRIGRARLWAASMMAAKRLSPLFSAMMM